MCILSGCDYLPSVCGIGLKKALDRCRRYGSAAQVIKSLRRDPNFTVSCCHEDIYSIELGIVLQRVHLLTEGSIFAVVQCKFNG